MSGCRLTLIWEICKVLLIDLRLQDAIGEHRGALNMSRILIFDAPSILGLKPSGVEKLPEALKAAGLLEALNAQYLGRIQPLFSYSSERDSSTKLLNGKAIRAFSLQLAESLKGVVHDRNRFRIGLRRGL